MREELVKKLNDAIEKLSPILKDDGGDKGVFLHQSIAKFADEETLEKIIADVESYIDKN